MDVADGEVSDSVMIAFLPMTTDWCKIDLPHMTLVYAGSKKDLGPTAFNELAKDTASLAALCKPFYLLVKATEDFGPEGDKVKALRFQPTTELWAMRRYVEKWNKSQFPFTPHATIGPVDSFVEFVPRSVGFDRLYLGWGEESLTFSLSPRFSSDY